MTARDTTPFGPHVEPHTRQRGDGPSQRSLRFLDGGVRHGGGLSLSPEHSWTGEGQTTTRTAPPFLLFRQPQKPAPSPFCGILEFRRYCCQHVPQCHKKNCVYSRPGVSFLCRPRFCRRPKNPESDGPPDSRMRPNKGKLEQTAMAQPTALSKVFTPQAPTWVPTSQAPM